MAERFLKSFRSKIGVVSDDEDSSEDEKPSVLSRMVGTVEDAVGTVKGAVGTVKGAVGTVKDAVVTAKTMKKEEFPPLFSAKCKELKRVLKKSGKELIIRAADNIKKKLEDEPTTLQREDSPDHEQCVAASDPPENEEAREYDHHSELEEPAELQETMPIESEMQPSEEQGDLDQCQWYGREREQPNMNADDSGTDCATSDDSDGESWLKEYTTLIMRPTRRRKIRVKMKNKDKVYAMSQPIRGQALILHMECFDEAVNDGQEDLDDRLGSEVDCKHIMQLFNDLNFKVVKHEDLSRQRILDVLRDVTQNAEHENYGMFVLVILSHGDKDVFYGSDGLGITHDELFMLLSPRKFSAMAGKPKWVIMQCCSGAGVDKHMIKTDYAEPATVSVKRKVDKMTSSVTDLVMFKASFPGFRSNRHTEYGSCFIKLLVELFYKHACHSDVQCLARKLRKRVQRETDKVSAQADISSQTVTVIETLHNDLYLFPLYNPDV